MVSSWLPGLCRCRTSADLLLIERVGLLFYEPGAEQLIELPPRGRSRGGRTLLMAMGVDPIPLGPTPTARRRSADLAHEDQIHVVVVGSHAVVDGEEHLLVISRLGGQERA